MRTTLDIDADVLQAAKERARQEKTTTGAVISELARRALNELPDSPDETKPRAPKAVFGLRPFPKRGGIVTNELIDTLRDDDAY